MFFDTHAHILDPAYEGKTDELLRRADEAGVSWIMAAGTDIADSSAGLDLAARKVRVMASAGIGPGSAGKVGPGWESELRDLVAAGGPAAIGECGLDAYHPDPPLDVQVPVFRTQVRLAKEFNLPLIVHSRKAILETLRIIEEEDAAGLGGVFHCIPSDEVGVRAAVKAGFHAGIGGTVTFPRNDVLRNIVKRLPRERILLETDSPYLAPQKMRGKRNEPAFLPAVAETVAQILDVPVEELGKLTRENGLRLFKKPERGKPNIVYEFKGNAYINLTSRCSARCVFCAREKGAIFRGLSLLIPPEEEPGAADILKELGDVSKFGEVVFCGYGEPTLRLDVLLEVGRALKKKGAKVRLDTNGHGSLLNGRDVTGELSSVVDKVCISLDAPDAATYIKIVRPEAGEKAFQAVLDFIKACKGRIPEVVATAVAIPGLDMKAVEKVAEGLGVRFEARPYFK